MNAENCEYCGSVNFEFERSCNKCGAPRKIIDRKADNNTVTTKVTGGGGNNLLYTYSHTPTIVDTGIANGKS